MSRIGSEAKLIMEQRQEGELKAEATGKGRSDCEPEAEGERLWIMQGLRRLWRKSREGEA